MLLGKNTGKNTVIHVWIPCEMKFLRVLIFGNFFSDPQKQAFTNNKYHKHFFRTNLLQGKYFLTYIHYTTIQLVLSCNCSLFNYNLVYSELLVLHKGMHTVVLFTCMYIMYFFWTYLTKANQCKVVGTFWDSSCEKIIMSLSPKPIWVPVKKNESEIEDAWAFM